MEYSDFRADILRINDKKDFKIRNSVKTVEIYNRSGIKDISYNLFIKIIRSIHFSLIGHLIKGKVIAIPKGFGIMRITKNKPTIRIVNGRLKTTLPVDWKKTLELWHTDKESHDKKLIVHKEVPYVYRLILKKKFQNFPYRHYYKFSITRANKLRIKESIENLDIIAFNLHND